ncbi:MAG: tRNA 2-thiouridine(34) synthase MnmA [bacterium]|uniref:tRNA-specific 2-thiouridylase MnmA n=1 Tax=Candidatus Aphodosoma intestinipullorum TaxID=2840674 RepID=A0A940IES1_9BACT|nr:tRNA 2-thiouridine(34) synthase MnmA [Candidatus Aphodosoma intestinipullorum]
MAMSGGIDSSVAAILLKEQGYELVGATYRTFDGISRECLAKEKGCCSVDSIMEARRMAHDMGFEHHIIDLRQTFRESVIADFIDEYLHGRTPNPCVVCNSEIKWGKLQQVADSLGCDYIATGHYARISTDETGRFFLRKGVDAHKDQTYFLWRLTQENLSRTLFPLGEMTKAEVRAVAAAHGYVKLSRKSESQEICFIPDNDYRHFLASNVESYAERYGEGYFVDTDGNVLGRHKGYPNYTIGQRKGLGIALGRPVYVVRIEPKTNRVVLGEREDLLSRSCRIKRVNMMKMADFIDGMEVMAKMRYKSRPGLATIWHDGDGIRVDFREPMESVTPGQSAVLYGGDGWQDVLCAGVIC